MALAGLDVDDVGAEGTGVATEQRVRQRAVAPVEAGEVQSDEQTGERIEHTLAEVRDLQSTPGQQDPVGKRVVDVAGDQQAVGVGVAFGDHPDHLGRR